MPSKIIDAYRQALAQQGVSDTRPDDFIVRDIGPVIQQEAPQIFEQDPELGQLWSQIRDADAPSLPAEFGHALRAGTKGLLSTGASLGALVTPGKASDFLREKAATLEQSAAEDRPTIPTIEDVAPGSTGPSKYFSRDALRYALSKAGGALPSLVEMGGTALAGAAIGSAVEPGLGTVAGAGEGVIEGLLGRGIIKSAIRSLLAKGGGESIAEQMVKRGLIKEATEAGVTDAIRGGEQAVADVVTRQAKTIVARRAGEAVNLSNIYGLTAGGIYGETGNRPAALGVGALGTLPFAIPGVSLGGQVLKRLFPELTGEAAQAAAQDLVGKRTIDLIKKAGAVTHTMTAGTAGVVTMEASNIVARNLTQGLDPLTLTDADQKRLREAAISGAIASAPFGALALKRAKETPVLPEKPAAPPPPAAEVPGAPPAPVAPRPTTDIVRQVSAMPNEEKWVRMAELGARARSPDEEIEFQLLQSLAPLPATTEVPAELGPMAAAAQPGAPAETLGRAMMGETPETIAEKQARDTAFAMAGATAPNAASEVEAAQREAAKAGRAMVGEGVELPPTGSDYEQYQELQRRIVAMGPAGFNTPEFQALWGQSEAIKNRHNGMPPEAPAAALPVPSIPAPVVPPGSLTIGLSSKTGAIPGLKRLADEAATGNEQSATTLRNLANDGLKFLMTDVKSAKIESEPVTGLYGGDIEPSLGVRVSFDESDRAPVLASLANFGEMFRQEQVHVRADPEPGTDIGHTYADGSFNTRVFRWILKKPMTREQIIKLASKAGLYGLTAGDGYLEVYNVARPEAKNEAEQFYVAAAKVTKLLGRSGQEIRPVTQRFWAYGSGDGAIPYAQIHGDIHPEQAPGGLAAWLTERLPPEPAVPALVAPVPAEPKIEAPVAEPEPAKPFEHGAVIEGAPSIDFRIDPMFQNLAPEKWGKLLTTSLESGPRSDKTGNRSLTRVAVAMQAPDGRVVVSGLTLPQKTLTTKGTTAFSEAAVQRMGVTRDSRRAIEVGGNHPATVQDVIAAGYRPIAVLHFAGEPGKIHQTFADAKAFDQAWGATEKTQGQQIRPPAMTAQPAISRNREAEITRKIDALGTEYLRAKDDIERNEIAAEIKQLYTQLEQTTVREQGQTGEVVFDRSAQLRTTAQQQVQGGSRASEFQAVMANLKNQGMRVDLFAKEIFSQSAREPIVAQIDQLKSQLATAQGSLRTEILGRIAQREARLAELDKAVGVAYSPWHVAISLDDVQKANLGNLVTLLHEAAESLTMRLNPVAKGVVLRAVDSSIVELQTRAAEASAKNGVPVSITTSSADLLAETLAQKLAAAGVDGSRSLAQSIVRWVKDLYYRTAMAVQRAFGAEPDIDTALNWFENQLRREVGGDYDFRLGDLMGRYVTVPLIEQVRSFTGAKDTPGGVADFYDPIDRRLSQPWVEPTSSEALRWNVEFRQADGLGDQNIPDPEARARIDAASLADVLEFGRKLHQEVAPDMPWADFWKLVGRGDDPALLIADQARRFAGVDTARVGGERMTKPMNDLASLNARILVEKIQLRQLRELAKAKRQIDESSATMVDQAKEINKVEGDVRNAALHDDTLRAKLKEMAKGLVQAMRRGLDTAHTHGRLAEAIRQAEGLMENDPIPAEYQRVLKAATDGTLPVFDSIRALAELDMPLTDMTNAEIVRAIRDNAELNPQLRSLAENKPLSVAIAELARSNVEQVDQIQLGWLRDTTRFREIHQQLDQIRTATNEQVREMARQIDERAKAKGLLERLKVGYLKRRRALQTMQNRIQVAEERSVVLEKALPPTAKRVDEMQQSAGGAYSEWYPVEGAKFTAMVPGESGAYTSERRTLAFNPDGSARDSDAMKRDVANNYAWLQANANRKGTKIFEQVKRQTMELAMLDIQRKYPAGWVNMLDRMVQPIGAEARSAGHSSGARIAQMLQQFEFISRSHRDETSAAAHWWTRAFRDVEESTGIQDHGRLLSQLYDPVMYFLNVNPGLDEQHAIREATRMARQLLPKPPAENFNERFATLLRRTKENSDLMMKIAEQYGVFVKDPRLAGELRSAVAQGWLTTPRSLRADVVQTVVRDMQAAGWTLKLKESTAGDGTPRQSVVRATTFDGLSAEDLDPKNSQVLAGALKRYFTPGIVDRWLVPFIHKPGSEIFSWGGDPIPQIEVQQAWNRAGGDVLKFIDNLSEGRQLHVDEESGADPLADFRGQILGQIDRLFGMEARLAYEAQQVRDLFDPMGPKPHVLMDARMNDLLPPEHVQFQSFDPTSSQRLLGMLAFHGSFGRNGERMVRTVNELKGVLSARKAEFDSLTGTTRSMRAAEAAARGLDYKQLEAAADRYAGVLEMQAKLRGLFGIGNPAGPFHDLRGGMEVMNAMAGQIVDQPKVGAYNLLSIAMRPFAMRSLGPMAVTASVRAYSNFLTTALGSFLENLNVHLMHSSEYAKEVGSVEGQVFRNLPWGTVLSDIGQRGRFQTSKTDRFLIQPLRALRSIQRKGVRVGVGEGAREFPRLAMIPGLGVLNSISQIAAQANTIAQVQMVERMVRSGIDHFNRHPTDLHDPAFRFTAAKLGIGKLDTGVYDYLRNKTVEYGMGNLEDMVRQSAKAAANGDRLLTRDQVLRLAQMTANELDGASSINTTPSILQTNPLLKIGMPLLRWPLWMMHAVHEGINTADGQRSLYSMAKGLGTLALWNLPVGIAFSFLMDQYDERLLHKKSSQRPVDVTAAIPLIGPALALTTGKDGAWNNAMGMLERSARAGNIYGLGADLAAQILSPYDPNSGQRSFSMDQRVLVMSQFLNFQQALKNLIAQGGAATWASFWRPAMMSIGGNGVLHSVDITNNLLGLDNAESRLVMRINAGNWLRSAGREIGLEVRSAGGASSAPTPMSVWTREMLLTSMANDRLGFLDSYRRALNAAREQVADDPRVSPVDREKEAASRVLASWGSRNPLEVFRFKPSAAQLAQLYSVMEDTGRQDTREAIQRYDTFTGLIKPSGTESYFNHRMSSLTPSASALQRRASGSGLMFSTSR